MENKYAKPQFIRCVLLLQEFDFEVNDCKGCENQVTNHLSCLEDEGKVNDELEIDESFLDEHVLAIFIDLFHWYADFF